MSNLDHKIVPCGELLCQKDSYMPKTLAQVVSCTPRQPPPMKGKKKKDKSKLCEFDVVLTDTVLFPEGGGQPSDKGTIGGVECLRVENVNGIAVHVVTQSLGVGSEVEVKIDWGRRWDLMTQHSAQHLITAIAMRLWNIATLSWGLGEMTSYLELDTPDLSAEQLALLEASVNEEIRSNHDVRPSWHNAEDMKSGAVCPEMRVSSRALPESVTGPVRVISIEGVDTNMCCGTHVQTTGHLQAIKLLRVDKGRGAIKVQYVAGERVLKALGDSWTRQSVLSSKLSTGVDQIVDRVMDLSVKQRGLEKTSKGLIAELVALHAESLKRDAGSSKVVSLHRSTAQQSIPPGDFLKGLASSLDGTPVLLVATVADGVSDKHGGQFIVSGPEEYVIAARDSVSDALSGRGGGRGNRFQGKCERLDEASRLEAVRRAQEALGAL